MSSQLPMTDGLKAEDWAGAMGQKWLAGLDPFENMIAPIGHALIERADFAPGERVIDIGCGGGATSLEIARRVAPEGSVLGLDISPDLVAAASERAKAAGLSNVSFTCADAATAMPEGAPFDRLVSRFGSMFFADPFPAFANLHRLVKPGGRIDLSVWAPARENQWISEMMAIIRRHVDVPAPIPRTPGPFALDDTAYIEDLLGKGGFSGIDIVAWEGKQQIGGAGATPESAVEFVLGSMSFADVLADCSAAVQGKAKSELIELFRRNQDAKGISMSGKAWLVTAIA